MKVRISTAQGTEFRSKDGLINPPDNFICSFLGAVVQAHSWSKRINNVKVKQYGFIDLKSQQSLDLEGKTIEVKEQ